MKKILTTLSILMSIPLMAEETIKLEKSVVKNSSRTAAYNIVPKEYKNTYVITQEKIQERNYKNVEDVLRDAPGVIVQNTAFGPRVDMRASGEKSISRVKVLIDGVSINPTEETLASLPINSIPIETVKKIEIIPGGGATLYGSGSVGGVVSITTNSNTTKNNFFMDLNYASYDNRNFGFAGGYNLTDKLYVNYGFNYLNSEDYREHEEKENKIYLTGFDYKINEKNRFRFQTRYSRMKQDGSNQLSKEELIEDRKKAGLNLDLETKDRSYTLDYEYRPTENLIFGATVYNQRQERDIRTDDIRDIRIIASNRKHTWVANEMLFDSIKSKMQADFKEKKDGIKLKGKYDYNKGELILGYDYQKGRNQRNSRVQSQTLKTYNTGYSDFNLDPTDRLPVINLVNIDLTKESHGIYAFNKFKVNDSWDLTTGARVEKTEYKGYRKNGPNIMPFVDPVVSRIETDEKMTNYAGEVGLLYKYNDTGRTFVRYERGFVTPFANQLTDKIHDTTLKNPNAGFIVPPVVNVASRYVANNLQSEITDTVELGFRDYIGSSLISTSLFMTDTTDEITLISSGTTNPAVNRWKFRNIGKTRRMGIELEAEQKLGNLTLSESVTFLDTKVLKSNDEAKIKYGDKVPMVPNLKLNFSLKYALTEKLSLIGTYTYLGKRETRELIENEDLTKDDKIIRGKIPAYGTMDLGLLYNADAYSNIKVGAKNILNKKYNLRETSLEALPAPERNYYLEMNVRF